MKSTASFAILIAVCSIGSVIASAAAAARAGGGGMAAGAGVHAMRAGPAFFHRGPQFARGFAARRAFRGTDLRRQPVPVLPYWLTDGDFDPFYYYPPADPAATEVSGEPAAPSQQPPNRILVARPGCRTQQQEVPSEAGGTQLVHITRCY
jgi:hypothetical protein